MKIDSLEQYVYSYVKLVLDLNALWPHQHLHNSSQIHIKSTTKRAVPEYKSPYLFLSLNCLVIGHKVFKRNKPKGLKVAKEVLMADRLDGQ